MGWWGGGGAIRGELYKSKYRRILCSFFFFNKFILFIYFWLHWVFFAARGLPLVAASGGYSQLRCVGFSLRWLLLLWSMGSRCVGFSSCDTWAQQLWLAGSRVQAQQLWCTSLVAPRHVGSSRTRERTRVPCIGRQILNHCTTREVPSVQFLYSSRYSCSSWLSLSLSLSVLEHLPLSYCTILHGFSMHHFSHCQGNNRFHQIQSRPFLEYHSIFYL